MRQIEVVRDDDDRLGRLRWTFWYDDRAHALHCSQYEILSRPTTRHKWTRSTVFDAYRRGSDLHAPPLPLDVGMEAMKLFTDGLFVDVMR